MSNGLNTTLLNGIKDRLIAFANEEGINLGEHFATPAEFKQFVIGFTIRSLVELLHLPVNTAYDMVMGDGSFQQLSETVWEQLQQA